MLSKKEIRKEIFKIRSNISEEFLYKSSRVITKKVLELEEYKKAKEIYIYINFGKEVITKNIIIDALAKGKKVALPKIINGNMNFYYITNIEEVSIGVFGILEPETNNIAISNDALMVMPGIAFDKSRNRIGYGKGYYDRYLEKKNLKSIALAFDFQILDEIGCEKFDIKPNKIITESKII